MSILDQITSTRKVRPRRVCLYGVHGIGKSTWASKWPKPLFLNLEDGLSDLDVPALPRPVDWDSFASQVNLLASEQELPFKTLVIDSIDWAESLAHKKIGQKALEDYGKGYKTAARMFRDLFAALNTLRDRANILLIAHAGVEKIEEPGQPQYTKYSPKLNKATNEVLMEWCDELLFCNYETVVSESKDRAQATRTERRWIYTHDVAEHRAKSRLPLPDRIPFDTEFTYGEIMRQLLTPKKEEVKDNGTV